MSFGQSQTISDKVQYIFMACKILTFLLNWVKNRLFIIVINVFYVVAVTQGQQQKPGSDKYSTNKVMQGVIKGHIFISYIIRSLLVGTNKVGLLL